jgi:hypothetical protein
LDDEEITHNLKLALGERAKNGFLTASDIIDIVSSLEMQAHFTRARIDKTSVLERTARRWLSKLGWRCGRHKGMYVDGHEHSDVVEYRQAFVERFQTMNGGFTLGTTPETSSFILLLQQQAPSVLFSSLMMNLCFIKMINSKFIGGVQAVRLQKQREKVSR